MANKLETVKIPHDLVIKLNKVYANILDSTYEFCSDFLIKLTQYLCWWSDLWLPHILFLESQFVDFQ